MRRRRLVAAALWFVFAFLVWNVRFDYGVRVGATRYLNQRALYLRSAAPPIEMASAMRATIADSARSATWISMPFAIVAIGLLVHQRHTAS